MTGGRLDYAALARLHRPTDPDALAAEARRLRKLGLTVQDIARAFGVAPEEASRLLSLSANLPQEAA